MLIFLAFSAFRCVRPIRNGANLRALLFRYGTLEFGFLGIRFYDQQKRGRTRKTLTGLRSRGNCRTEVPGGPMMLPASRRVENAWMTLEQHGAPPADLLSVDIYDSWMRCISFGLDTLRPPSPEFVSPAILRQDKQRCPPVLGLALAEMHTLHQQIAGSNFMIAFANADGLLLDIISDPSFSDASNAACIRPGTVWTESICGTNGLGTAAHLKRAIVV